MPAPTTSASTTAAGNTKYHHHDCECEYYLEANDCHHHLPQCWQIMGKQFASENGV